MNQESAATQVENAPSGFWRRLFAFTVDSFLLGVVGFGLGALFGNYFEHIGGWGRVIGFVIALLYFSILDSAVGNGQTFGKRLLKIKVIAADGKLLSVNRSMFRFAILGIPYFLNGAPINLGAISPWVQYLLSILVFGIGGSIAYLLIFNRKTRQSLHDLIVGSYVVRAIDQNDAPIHQVIWRGHYVVTAVLIVASIVLPFITGMVANKEPFNQMLSLQGSLMSEPEVMYATMMDGSTSFASTNKATQTQRNLAVRIVLAIHPADPAALADKLARIIFAAYPEAVKRDGIVISLSHGYDIGIASSWRTENFAHSPSQWQERLDSKPLSPAISPTQKSGNSQ